MARPDREIDDRPMTPQELARLCRAIPEARRWAFLNSLLPPLDEQVIVCLGTNAGAAPAPGHETTPGLSPAGMGD